MYVEIEDKLRRHHFKCNDEESSVHSQNSKVIFLQLISSKSDWKLSSEDSKVILFQLISLQNWPWLKAFIYTHKSVVAKYNTCHSILHYACRFDPPLGVIKLIHKVCPSAVFEKDHDGRFALHIACKYGCRLEVIEYLLQENTSASRRTDRMRCTPLHLLFKSEREEGMNDKNDDLKLISKALIKAAPLSVLFEDNDGFTALEHAIDGLNDMSIITHINKATSRIRKELSKHVMEI